MSDSPLLVTLRGLVLPVYLPWMSGGLGVAMLLPVLPVYLRESGMSFTLVSVVLATTGIGAMLGGLPVGAMLGRFGEDRVMVAGLVVMAGATALLGVGTAVIGLSVLRLAHGLGSIGLRLSTQTIVTRTVSPDQRGRSLALMGGTMRLSILIGPLVGGVLADQIGYSWTFAISGAATLLGVLPVAVLDANDIGKPEHELDGDGNRPGLWTALKVHRRLLFVGGIGPALVMSVRQGRLIILALLGDSLGLSNSAIGGLVAIGTAADLALFPVAGYIMDRYGRLWAIVPSFSLIGVGLLALAAADNATTVTIAAAIMGIGNGIGAGTMLTLGSDLAPRDNPGQFLSALASIQNFGRILGPLTVGYFADAIGLKASAVVMFVATAWIVILIGETSDRHASDI